MSGLFKSEFPPLLADGLQLMTVGALRKLCVTGLSPSDTREEIMHGLEALVKKLKVAKIRGELWTDGSFLTEKIDPDDVDFTLCVKWSFVKKCSPEQVAILEWLNMDEDEPDSPKKLHRCHTFLWIDYPKRHPLWLAGQRRKAYWLKQWGRSRTDEKKGIAVVKLPGSKK